jgi:predicted nucleotidyltransferase
VAAAIAQPLADREARHAADRLGREDGVRAVCVIGSGARGDFDAASDIDLLVLVDDRATAARVRARFPRAVDDREIQLKLVTEAQLTRLFERRSTFGVHVLREGVAVIDHFGAFETLRARHPRDTPVRNNRGELLVRLELYDDIAWCQGLYLYCLADLYSIGRAAVFTLLGRQSRFEFSGTRAFDRLRREAPELAAATECIAELRPFFLLVERDSRQPLPFPARDCHAAASWAVEACRTLVDAIR